MTEPWIRVHANLAEKPIVLRAAKQLRISVEQAIGHLVRFWGAMSRLGEDGSVRQLDDAEIEAWAGWPAKREGQFAEFIRTRHADSDGRINEWDDYAGALEERRARDRERQQRRRDERRQRIANHAESTGRHTDVTRTSDDNPSDVTPSSNGRHAGVAHESVPARAVRDDTKRNETTTTPLSTAREERAQPLFGPGLPDVAAGLAPRLASDVDRAALGVMLGRVPQPETWVAELTASLDGMPGHCLANAEQLGEAIRDWVGNGAAENPSLRQLRRYVESAAHPVPARPLGFKGSSTRNDAALRRFAEEDDHGH